MEPGRSATKHHSGKCPAAEPLNHFGRLSHENLELVVKHGGTPYIPFKSNSVPGEPGSIWDRMFGYFQFNRQDFLKHYHARSNVESTFSMCKAKFGDAVRSKTDTAMKNEVLCKFL